MTQSQPNRTFYPPDTHLLDPATSVWLWVEHSTPELLLRAS